MFKWIKKLLNADTDSQSVTQSVQVTSPQAAAALTAIEVAVTTEPKVKKPRAKKPAAEPTATKRTATATPPKQSKKSQ
jgi:hypothetical protein